MEKIDLTKLETYRQPLKVGMEMFTLMSTISSNPLMLVYRLADMILKRNTVATKYQQKAAEELIAAGKRNGVKTLEFDVDNTTGFKLKIPVEDCNIDTIIGTNDKMTIKVTYK